MASTSLKITGLKTSNNPLTSGEGALRVADNVVIKFKDQIDPRRGQQLVGGNLGNSYSRANQMWFYGGQLFAQHDQAVAQLFRGSFSDLTGTVGPPTNLLGIRTRAVEAQQDLFFTSAAGVQFMDSSIPNPVAAGVPRAKDPLYGQWILNTGTGAWMLTNGQSAYRIVYGKRTAENRLMLGAPSGRTVVTNSSGSTQFVILGGLVQPPAITSSHIMRIYRTLESVSSTTDPGDNYYLAYEGPCGNTLAALPGTVSVAAGVGVATVTVTYANHGLDKIPSNQQVGIVIESTDSNFPSNTQTVIGIVDSNHFTFQQNATTFGGTNASTITITPMFQINDTAPDSVLGPPLYTNPQDGDGSVIGASDNAQPPLCLDIAPFNFRVWYANTKSKQRLQLQLIGCGLPAGLQSGDTITVNGLTYTAAGSSAVGQFVVTTGGSAAANIQQTAQSLCQAINSHPLNTTLTAYYIAGANTAPGLIQLEENGIGMAAFSVYASRNTAWAPYLTSTGVGAITSTNDAAPNRLFYSKVYQPEAVPLLNYLDVGSRFKNILRILPLRDRLYVFKEDGIFIVSGQGNYQVNLLDSTARLVAPETAQAFDNQLFALTNQGVVSVSELGVRVISQPIEDVISALLASVTGNPLGGGLFIPSITALQNRSFAVGYESERSYLLAVPTFGGDAYATQVFVYNYNTDAWTRWPIARSSGVVDPLQDVLYMGSTLTNDVYRESKTYTSADNFDDWYFLTYVSGGAGTCTLRYTDTPAGLAPPVPGDRIAGTNVTTGKVVYGLITSVSAPSGSNVTVNFINATDQFGGGSQVVIYKAIKQEVQWHYGLTAPPGQLKSFSEFTLHFKRLSCHLGNTENYTELDQALVQSGLTTDPGWGSNAWGAAAWGDPAAPLNRRALIAAGKHWGTYLVVGWEIQEAMSDWALNGVTLESDPISERTTGSPGST